MQCMQCTCIHVVVMAEKDSRIERLLPEDQQREKEKDGRIRRILCDVLKLRVLAYIIAQPAAFTFILALLLIAASMPPIGSYIKTHNLPDLFTMRIWNAYLGDLPSVEFCPPDNTDEPEVEGVCYNNGYQDEKGNGTVGVKLNFLVDKGTVESDTYLFVNLTGKDVKTKIKDSESGERLDELIFISIHIRTDACVSHHCHVNACVTITAPMSATPTRMPRIPKDFTFESTVFNHHIDPSHQSCNCSELVGAAQPQRLIKCKKGKVRPAKETYKRHGLINIYFTEEERKVATSRLMLAAVAVAALAVAFSIGIVCTERPPKHKPSIE